MTPAELDQLVAQIGEEILARMGPSFGQSRPVKGEGLNIPDLVCPGCTQRCAQTCHQKTKAIVAAGADRVSASEKLTAIDSSIARLIDHTLLKADATAADVKKLCAVAHEGIIGAITGRAIYEGTIDFAAAQKLADELS